MTNKSPAWRRNWGGAEERSRAGQPQAGRRVTGGQWTAQGGRGTPGEEVNADLSATEGLSAGRAGKMVCTFKKSLWLRRGGEQRYKCRRLWLVPNCEQLGGAETHFTREFSIALSGLTSRVFFHQLSGWGWNHFLRSLRKEAVYGKKGSPGFPCYLKVECSYDTSLS